MDPKFRLWPRCFRPIGLCDLGSCTICKLGPPYLKTNCEIEKILPRLEVETHVVFSF